MPASSLPASGMKFSVVQPASMKGATNSATSSAVPCGT
jgi:hypothetical protein